MTADETRGLARAGAVAGLCPITEANLGDGIFNARDFLARRAFRRRLGFQCRGSAPPTNCGSSNMPSACHVAGAQRAWRVAGGSTGAALFERRARRSGGARRADAGGLAPGAPAPNRRRWTAESPVLAGRAGDAFSTPGFSARRETRRRPRLGGGRKVVDGGRSAGDDRGAVRRNPAKARRRDRRMRGGEREEDDRADDETEPPFGGDPARADPRADERLQGASSLHSQIIADVEARILGGQWPPGHRIPYEHELTELYGCSRMTVSKALTQLARAGLIERRRKAGSFVMRPFGQSALLEIRDVASGRRRARTTLWFRGAGAGEAPGETDRPGPHRCARGRAAAGNSLPS